jgi:hypothetical protein
MLTLGGKYQDAAIIRRLVPQSTADPVHLWSDDLTNQKPNTERNHAMFSTSSAARNELTLEQMDAISGGTASETAQGVALVTAIAAESVALAGLKVVGAMLGATHTKG